MKCSFNIKQKISAFHNEEQIMKCLGTISDVLA